MLMATLSLFETFTKEERRRTFISLTKEIFVDLKLSGMELLTLLLMARQWRNIKSYIVLKIR